MAYYSYDRIRSHNSVFNCILSNRGGGKTFGSKLISIRDFIKTKEKTGVGTQFAYVRRYDSELDNRFQFFDDIIASDFFNDYEFKVVGYRGYIREKDYELEEGEENKKEWFELCHFIPLSISLKFKSTAYPFVTKIFFDEFIIDKGNSRYLKNEVEIFLDLFETIARKRDNVTAFLLANNVSLVNPYFTYFDIKIDQTKRFNKSKNGMVTVELFVDEEFMEEKKQTRFGKLIAGTRYGNYAIENQSLRDNFNFITGRPKAPLQFISSFIYDNREIGVWYCETFDMFYVDHKIDIYSKNRFTILDSDKTPNLKTANELKRSGLSQRLKSAFDKNKIFYKDLEHQDFFKEILKFI